MIQDATLRLLGGILSVAVLSMAGNRAAIGEPPAELAAPEKVAAAHLPNVYRVHAKLISGGLPEGDAAFAELRELGVKTIISVDGAKPDLARARQFGLRYVHLPHGYDGIPDQRAKELAKAVRDLDGPIYLHCHHGKHRSPAAAAVACIELGWLEPSAAQLVLKTAGTSENYRGLYESVRAARLLDTQSLDALQAEFPASAKLPPLAESMVAIEHTHDHLKAFAAGGWKTLQAHPDLDPTHEALLLREHFTELRRSDAVKAESAEFRQLVRESELLMERLESDLRKWQAAKPSRIPESIPVTLDQITAGCATCHRRFRDVPLGEKAKQGALIP